MTTKHEDATPEDLEIVNAAMMAIVRSEPGLYQQIIDGPEECPAELKEKLSAKLRAVLENQATPEGEARAARIKYHWELNSIEAMLEEIEAEDTAEAVDTFLRRSGGDQADDEYEALT